MLLLIRGSLVTALINRGVPAVVNSLLTLLLPAQLVIYLQVMDRGENLVELMWLKKITIFHRSFEIGNKQSLSSSCNRVCPPHSASGKGLLTLCHTLVTPLSEQAQLIRFPSQLSTMQCAFSYQASHSGCRSGTQHRFPLPSLPMGSWFHCFPCNQYSCSYGFLNFSNPSFFGR